MDKTTLGYPDPEPTTRPKMSRWDRSKFLLLFLGVWGDPRLEHLLELEIVGRDHRRRRGGRGPQGAASGSSSRGSS